MTNQELNRDIKRLAKRIQQISKQVSNKVITQDVYFHILESECQKEFTRLFGADRDFTAMTRTSILIMLRLNIRHRFVALHNFGLNIDLDKLV